MNNALTLAPAEEALHTLLETGPDRPNDLENRVEGALLARALGYDYQETKEEWSEKTGARTVTVSHHVGPDVRAQIFWLKNRCPQRWKERPTDTGDGEEVTIIDDL